MDNTFKERLQEEYEELLKKTLKLQHFLVDDEFNNITPIQKSLLFIQLNAMKTYASCLNERLQNL